MVNVAVSVFLILTFITITIDVLVAIKSFDKRNTLGLRLGYTILCAAIVCITYAMSVMSSEYVMFSLWSSLYFISIDWMLVFLVMFIANYTRLEAKPFDIGIRCIIYYAIAETAVFLINPFKEISIGYLPCDNSIVKFEYDKYLLYDFHLAFTYGLIILVMVFMIRKAISVPKQYRKKFVFIIYAILVVVGINSVFLFFKSSSVLSEVDCSIFTYSVVIVLMYWFAFIYSTRHMLEGLSMTVFSNLEQGIMLFDYDGLLVMSNEKAENLFCNTTELDKELHIHDFLKDTGINIDETANEDNYSLQCYVSTGSRNMPIRCDYSCIRDGKGHLVSYMLVFTDLEMETDLLTEFHNWEYFIHYAHRNPEYFVFPMGIVAFDINNLGVINSSYGKEAGDAKLSSLAEIMRNCFTKNTYFVRREACLFALCYNPERKNLDYCAECVKNQFDGNIQYALALTDRSTPEISDAIEEAYKALRTKKLLDRDSNRSQILSSLLKALQESDGDTEAHVQRTQNMGRELGKRIGLSDSLLSALSLLCLLHDIGKIGIPLEILNKPGKLSKEEWEVLKTHPEKGYQIAMSSRDFSHIADEILHHHERWDGKGYPAGLSRESIPLLSRIISVIDAFDAMVNDRPYRKGMSVEAAIEELRRSAGSQFDPHITLQFIQMISEGALGEAVCDFDMKDRRSDPSRTVDADVDEEQDNSILYNTHDVVYSRYRLDTDDTIIEVDDNFEKITGYSAEEITNGSYSQKDLIPEEDRSVYFVLVQEQLARKSIAVVEHRIICKDGDIIYVLCIGRQFYDSAVKRQRSEIIISKITDTYAVKTIAEVEDNKARRRLEQWENTYRRDSLTGLLTHNAFRNDVDLKLLSGDSRILFLMIDIDKFKDFNDTYGHKAGDEYLILVANTIKSALRRDDLACRMGGDEFACALFFNNEHTNEFMYQRAQQIFDKINLSLGSGKDSGSLSMGAVVSGSELNTFAKLYESADEVLYESKNKGRGRLTVGE